MFSITFLTLFPFFATTLAQLTPANLKTYPNTLTLDHAFNPVIPSYWTNYPHHRRTPFAVRVMASLHLPFANIIQVAPNGKSAYLAYLDSTGKGVHVQKVDPITFKNAGAAVTVPEGVEAGGMIAHNDGFALLTRQLMPAGTSGAPAGADAKIPVAILYRFTSGQETWKTWLGGPNVHSKEGLSCSPDLTGDLVFSDKAGYYGAYFVVKSYQGWNKGHSADNIAYVDKAGKLTNVPGTSSWACSHNLGIALEEADAPPYASICAEDHTGLWLNTKTRGMNGQKISNEHVTNYGTNDAMGGTSGSFSVLARFPGTEKYIFTWVSRGAKNLQRDSFMMNEVKSQNRTSNRNVAMAILKDKFSLLGEVGTSKAGSKDGDLQVNWVTKGTVVDRSWAHVAAFDPKTALMTWEEIAQPTCVYDAMGCMGAFSGTYFQLVDDMGKKIGSFFSTKKVTVGGDMVTMPDGRICWPTVDMDWKLEGAAKNAGGWVVVDPKAKAKPTSQKMGFACVETP